MISLPNRSSRLRSNRKKSQLLLTHGTTIFCLFIFSILLLQPHKFRVVAQEDTNNQAIQQVYSDLLATAQQESSDGAIAFESIISAGQTKISYTVAPGDTLSKIAKLFGTTIDAITKANEMNSHSTLRVGQQLIIAYDKSIIHEIKEDTSVGAFAQKYELPLQDLLTLNYFEDEDDLLETGQQIFVPLNKVEAQEKGLLERKEFVMLDIPEPELPEPERFTVVTDEEVADQQPLPDTYQQKIISAEETQAQLDNANKPAPEVAQQEQPVQQSVPQQQAPAVIEEPAPKQEPTPQAAPPAQEQQLVEEKTPTKPTNPCNANQCYHEGECWALPENATCAPEDLDNAWTCLDGYIDTGRACISDQAHQEKVAQASLPKRSDEILEQWYFNPYNDGYSNGWAGGHCTHYAGWYWWKNFGISTDWRGNALAWYNNAKAAGWKVGQTPQPGAIIVMKYGASGRRSYGHVGVVKDIDRERRQVLIESMNVAGRYIATLKWEDMDSTINPVVGYIYPEKA